MPQLNKGGKLIFGKSLIRDDLALSALRAGAGRGTSTGRNLQYDYPPKQ